MKRLILTVCVLLTSVNLWAELETVNGIILTYSVSSSSNEATITDCTFVWNSSNELEIPESLGGCPVTSIGKSAFLGCQKLTSIKIPSTVTSIGEAAFYECTGLTSITIPSSVTSIGSDAFWFCSNLTSITISPGLRSIGDWAFRGCEKLTAVNISDLASWCLIDFSNTSSNPLTYAKNLYLNGLLITELIIPDGLTAILQESFYGNPNLTSVVIPPSVTSIGSRAFSNCSNLRLVEIPEGVVQIGTGAFYQCSKLESLTLPKSLKGISSNAFFGCWGLESVTILSNDVSIPKGAFTSVYPEFLKAAKPPYGMSKSSIKTVIIPDSVSLIEEGSFSGCSQITSITIPEGVTTIEAEAFKGCKSLTNVTLPSTITYLGCDAFADCADLTSVIFKFPPPQLSTSYKGIEAFPTSTTGYYTLEVADVWRSITKVYSNHWNSMPVRLLSLPARDTSDALCEWVVTNLGSQGCHITFPERESILDDLDAARLLGIVPIQTETTVYNEAAQLVDAKASFYVESLIIDESALTLTAIIDIKTGLLSNPIKLGGEPKVKAKVTLGDDWDELDSLPEYNRQDDTHATLTFSVDRPNYRFYQVVVE